jgi:hypothetical protein
MSNYNISINVPYSGQTNVLTGFDDCTYIFVQASIDPILAISVLNPPTSVVAAYAGIYPDLASIPNYTTCDQLRADGDLVEQDGPDGVTTKWSFDEVCVASTDPDVTQYVEVWACLSDGSVLAASPNSFSVGGLEDIEQS